MKNSIYQNARQLIKDQAKEIKRTTNDKGYIRQSLNDLCDDMISQFNYYAMKEKVSEKQAKLYAVWLASFTADQHPK